jgi:hypothetical protein
MVHEHDQKKKAAHAGRVNFFMCVTHVSLSPSDDRLRRVPAVRVALVAEANVAELADAKQRHSERGGDGSRKNPPPEPCRNPSSKWRLRDALARLLTIRKPTPRKKNAAGIENRIILQARM